MSFAMGDHVWYDNVFPVSLQGVVYTADVPWVEKFSRRETLTF